MDQKGFGLVGDVGGTHVRLAVTRTGGARPRLEAIEEHEHGSRVDLFGAVADYLGRNAALGRPGWAVIAVAGPVTHGEVSLTNAAGRLSEAELSRTIGGGVARLINDFAALALAAPVLGPGDLHPLGPAIIDRPEGSIAIIGPGTGLGVSALIRDGQGEAVAAGEGGHVGFAPTDEVEVEVWRRITAEHGRCSLERLICGPGLMALHAALGGSAFKSPADLVAAASGGELAAQASVRRFCEILGSAAGDAALAYGARGGVLIGGGVAPRLLRWLEEGGFRRRFEAKGRFESYMRAIPTAVITEPHAALLGAARALSS